MTSITTRAGKGTPLTHTEVDDNFTNLNADKLEASNNLSDVSSASAARTNLGLGTAARECEGKHEPLDLGQGGGLRGVHDPDVDPAFLVVMPNELHVGADQAHGQCADVSWKDILDDNHALF